MNDTAYSERLTAAPFFDGRQFRFAGAIQELRLATMGCRWRRPLRGCLRGGILSLGGPFS